MRLAERASEKLRLGYRLVTWSGNERQIESHVDRVKKKIARLTKRQGPEAKRWLYYASLGWTGLLTGASVDFVLARFEQVQERDYAKNVLLPRFLKQFDGG